jgi:hypothetical protein
MPLTPDTFSAAYPVTQEHLRWALDYQLSAGLIDDEEYARCLRALEAEAAPPPNLTP